MYVNLILKYCKSVDLFIRRKYLQRPNILHVKIIQTREFCHMLMFTIGVQKIAKKEKVYDIEVKNKNSRHLKFFEIINNNWVRSLNSWGICVYPRTGWCIMFDPTHWTINWLPSRSKTCDIAATTKFPLKMGSIKYPKEKIADVKQASFQSFFIMKTPLAWKSDYDSARAN